MLLKPQGVGRRTMRGQSSPACCLGASTEVWSLPILASVAVGCIVAAVAPEKIWTAADEAAFLERAPAHLHLALLLALWTGQRQGDLLRLPWSSYDRTHIRLQQRKTGARVVIPVGTPLKAALDVTPKVSTIILTNSDGKPWTSDGFRASWRKACNWRVSLA